MADAKKNDSGSTKGKFVINFSKVISELEGAMNKFPVKKILYRTIFKGKGLEFDSFRKFEQNDDASLIDWKASLKSNNILARKYVEERDLNVYFLVDVSASMLFGSRDKLKAEYAAEFVASLAHLIVGSGDRIGLVMFSDNVKKIVLPSNNRNQFPLFMKFLSDPSFYGGGFDLSKAVDHVLKTVNTPYTVFIIISDFIKTSVDHERVLKLMGTRFETIGVMIRDPMDDDLPETKYQLAIQDPYSNKQMVLDPIIARANYKAGVERHKNMVRDLFRKSRIDFLELMTNKNFPVYFASFLRQISVGGGRT